MVHVRFECGLSVIQLSRVVLVCSSHFVTVHLMHSTASNADSLCVVTACCINGKYILLVPCRPIVNVTSLKVNKIMYDLTLAFGRPCLVTTIICF